jgi:translation initiation factor IF-2
LVQHNLTPEDWGGDIITVPMSALNGDGVDDLLEMILLNAEVNEYKANPNGPVKAVVIESHLDPQKGAITSILVRDGTLRSRDVVVVDMSVGRIKTLMDDHGQPLNEVGPGMPAQLLGLDEVPTAGATLEVVKNLNEGKALAQQRKDDDRARRLAPVRKSMTDLMSEMLQRGKLRLVLKADSAGSLEVMESELKKIDLKDVSIDILFTGVGPIGESDVMLAASGEDAQAAVVGFRTTVDKNAAQTAQSHGMTLRTYNIIYDLTREVERALRLMLEPEFREVKLGEVEVRDVFKIPRVGTVAGCYVRDGTIMRNGQIRVYRDGVEIHQGPIRNLKRFDDDARQVEKGKECGILLQDFNDIQVGDSLENFKMEEIEV